MTKKDAGKKPKGPGRPSKGKLKVTMRFSPRVVAVLSKGRDKTGRDKSALVEEAIIGHFNLEAEPPAKKDCQQGPAAHPHVRRK